MKTILATILILIFAFSVFAQKDVASLNPKHAVALKQFLSKNKQYGFLSERAFDKEYLKEYRATYGKTIKPYYEVGDFNFDGFTDFALLLTRKGKPTPAGGDPPWDRDYPLVVVIFNGNRQGGFTKAFIENVEAPLVSLIKRDGQGKRKRLFFTIYASDADIRIFKPVGKSYITEYPEAP